jgi:protein tyrosine/serine phosphatase
MFRKDHPVEYYAAKREKREARWNRPITSRRERARAWFDLIIADHGFLRLIHLNLYRLDDKVWRSAQPAPHDLERMARLGLRSIVNLRGGRSHGAWQLEKDASERLGLTVVDLVLRSREAPEKAMLLTLPEFFAKLEYPVLAHCKSGADRAGLFAALYLLVVKGADATTALAELSLRKGHFRYAQTGVLDAFIEEFRDTGEKAGKPFMDWVREDYDPARLTASFRPRAWSSFISDGLLRRE